MNKQYLKPTMNMSAIMAENATDALKEVLVSMKAAIAGLIADKAYIAIQSGVLSGTPEDFGVVRYSAHFHHPRSANPTWVKLDPADQDRFAKYLEGNKYVQVTINIPGICQLRITAEVTANGSIVLGTLHSEVESALSTLLYVDIMAVIDSVKAVGLLTAPQLVEKLED